ncbi:Kiwa anti-phage protein KwaB-like domain-containing protein [Desulfosporosinus sp. SYSU MS00001]|uniref:Kiwa anti-phage protein KwaB-like domain-containing protein n=1 Tax=Desulfosporosinus sp. SYSU MS00001 TaxID=3416284 RepID=UPI003CF7FF20
MKEKIKRCLEVLEGDVLVSLVLVAHKKGDREYRNVRLGTSLADVFRSFTREYFKSISQAITDNVKELKEYNAGYKADAHEIEYLTVTEEINTSLNDVIKSIPSDIKPFDLDETKFLNKLSYYFVMLSNSIGDRVILFRKYNSKKELTRSGLFAAILNNGIFDRLEYKTLLFDDKIDCFYFNGSIFVENTYYFQLIFDYYEGLKANAETILETIASKIPVSGWTEFHNHCIGNQNMLAKLNNVASKPYFRDLTMADLRRTIDHYGLDIQVIEEDGVEKLLYLDTDRWGLLKLLDDDYLDSVMTNGRYLVNSKKAIS